VLKPVVAIEGPHRAGKSAIAHTLTALLRQRGLLAEMVPDEGRRSPYVQDRVHGIPQDPLATELELLGRRVTAELDAQRFAQVCICDRSVLSGRVYLEMLGDVSDLHQSVVASMTKFIVDYAEAMYSLVVVIDRHFPQDSATPSRGRDPFAPTDPRVHGEYTDRLMKLVKGSAVPVLRLDSYEPSEATAMAVVEHLQRSVPRWAAVLSES
jgi:thymidylate kinase